MNIFNSTELLKIVKMVNFIFCIFYHNKNWKIHNYNIIRGFSGGLDGKKSACHAEDPN